MFKLIAFDMDGTLTPSKWKMDDEMIILFRKLLKKFKVAIISWWKYELFQRQVLPHLWNEDNILENLYVCPTCSTAMYLYKNWDWQKEYSLDLSKEEKEHIISVLNNAIDKLGLKPAKLWWEMVEDRNTQITISTLWQEAPIEEKEKYDPDFSKRKKIRDFMMPDLVWFNVLVAWSTSIDITREWVDKAYWIRKLSEVSWIGLNEMIFVWDALFPGWNDYPPLEIWVTSKRVFSIDDTKRYIEMLISE